ncbi:MAG TPA: dihydrolipoamide acetyltransferase family protein [Phycisphaerales bacterium]|nr:dihydrolipoamide acetyltransferase family protein [Phycisphaerales bacterium]
MSHAKTSSNPNDFILPDLGEGVHEAELLKWRVQVGQTVSEHDILADMETDKAVVEVPSPRTGVIAALHGKEGEILKVGNALVTYAAPTGTGVPPVSGAGGAPAKSASKAAPAPSTNGSHKQPASDTGGTPVPPTHEEDAGTVVGKMGGALAGITAEAGKALATPAVRRLARDLGLDIDSVPGTGIGGRVLEKDVRGAAPGGTGLALQTSAGSATSRSTGLPSQTMAPRPPSPSPSSPSPSPSPEPRHAERGGTQTSQDAIVRIPFRGVRRTIANRLRESVNQAVHFNVMDEADVAPLDHLRKKLAAASGEKLSFLPFVASAVCRVLTTSRFRGLNATVDEKSQDPGYEAAIIQHRAVHIGIATDTDSGLMVPVIRDCDGLGVLEIGRHITHAAESARSRTAGRESLMGSTFTISNVGSHAGRFATPIINYPEVAILAVGRARPAPVIRGGGIFVGNLLPLSLACDHRVVDGATAALALAEIIRLLQEPESLLGPARG